MLPDLPGEVWALIGILVTTVGALIRERYKVNKSTTSSPYEAMADRLEKVERRAAMVPELTARFSILADWATDAAKWMTQVYEAYEEDTGVPFFPPPPVPPPHWDRRTIDTGPPQGMNDRRA